MSKRNKRNSSAKRSGDVRKRGREMKTVTTFEGLDALVKSGYKGLIDFVVDRDLFRLLDGDDSIMDWEKPILYDELINDANMSTWAPAPYINRKKKISGKRRISEK